MAGALESWWRLNGRQFPWRTSDNAFHRLLAEVLLQRTRAQAVAGIWDEFVDAFPRPSSLAEAALDEIEKVVAPLGLGLKRATYLKQLGGALVTMGEIPLDVHALRSLPGVGPYSAGAFVATWGRIPAAPVDANIRRVVGRVIWGADTVAARTLEAAVTRMMKSADPEALVLGLVDFGATPCSPRSPRCIECPLRRSCKWQRESLKTNSLRRKEHVASQSLL